MHNSSPHTTSMSPFILQQIWKVNNIWMLQNMTVFITVKHYTVKCKYKVRPMHIYLECYSLK